MPTKLEPVLVNVRAQGRPFLSHASASFHVYMFDRPVYVLITTDTAFFPANSSSRVASVPRSVLRYIWKSVRSSGLHGREPQPHACIAVLDAQPSRVGAHACHTLFSPRTGLFRNGWQLERGRTAPIYVTWSCVQMFWLDRHALGFSYSAVGSFEQVCNWHRLASLLFVFLEVSELPGMTLSRFLFYFLKVWRNLLPQCRTDRAQGNITWARSLGRGPARPNYPDWGSRMSHHSWIEFSVELFFFFAAPGDSSSAAMEQS